MDTADPAAKQDEVWRRISTKIRGDESATRFRHAPVTMLNMDMYEEGALGRDVVHMSERGELAVYKRYADGDKWLKGVCFQY